MTKATSQAKPPPKRAETVTLKVFIHCEGCRRKVRRIIRVLDGVEEVTVDQATGKVTVTGSNVDSKAILQRLQKYGKQAEIWPSSAPIPAPSNPAIPAGKAGSNQPKPHSSSHGSESSSKKKGSAGADGGGGEKAAAPATESGSKKGDAGKEANPSTPGKVAGNESKLKNGGEGKPEEDQKGNSPNQGGGGGGDGGAGRKKGGKKGGNASEASSDGSNSYNSGGGEAEATDQVPLPPPRLPDMIPAMAPPPHSSIEVAANRSLAPYDSVQTGYAYQSAEYATHMFSDENANNCIIISHFTYPPQPITPIPPINPSSIGLPAMSSSVSSSSCNGASAVHTPSQMKNAITFFIQQRHWTSDI